jgi:hypothetical protein
MKVIGLCRFSFPALGGFQVEHRSRIERLKYLFNPARMEERFRHFETICLPSIRAQTDPDFQFLILVGRALPAPYRERLKDLIADVPQAIIISRTAGPHREVCQRVINGQRDLDQPCLQFRHDDDDAIAVNFVETLRQAARDCAPLLEQHKLVGFDWNRGYIARPGPKGIFGEVQNTPYWGVAMATAVKANVRMSIMNFGHRHLNQHMPTVTFNNPVMYLRGHNDYNDSRQKDHIPDQPMPLLDRDGEADLKRLFNIDADHVRQVFSRPPVTDETAYTDPLPQQ